MFPTILIVAMCSIGESPKPILMSRIAGKWCVDRQIAASINTPEFAVRNIADITFTVDGAGTPEWAADAMIPKDEMPTKFFGTMSYDNNSHPYAYAIWNGNPTLAVFKGAASEMEFFHVNIAVAQDQLKDRIFLGGFFGTETCAYGRVVKK